MPLSIAAAGPRDARGYAETYVAAFYEEAFHAAMYRDMSFDVQVTKTAELWPGFCSSPTSFTQKITDTETGEMIAFARWTICNSEALVKKLKGRTVDMSAEAVASIRHPEGIDEELTARYQACVKEKKAIYMGERPYMHLNLLGTKPGHYRRGAGGMLLKWMGDFADREGVHCYVESTEMGKQLYERYGFAAKETISMSWDGGSIIHYCMAREPRS